MAAIEGVAPAVTEAIRENEVVSRLAGEFPARQCARARLNPRVGVATQDGKYLLVIERDELKDLGITKLKVLRVVQEAIDELRTQQALLIPEGVAVKKWQLKRRFAAFLSHNKAEAAAEARLAKEKLVELLKQDVFLDSDDLQNLDRLLSSVRDSDVLILFQTRNMLSRELTQVDRAWLPSRS